MTLLPLLATTAAVQPVKTRVIRGGEGVSLVAILLTLLLIVVVALLLIGFLARY